MDYITGSDGFVGTHLLKALNRKVSAIPHEFIQTTKIPVCENFFFLSAYGNMSHHTDEDMIIRANILDLIHILKQINFENLHSFVFISSSSVKLKVKTMYSRTKNAAEEILLAYAEKYNAPICIIRPFSITGVGEQKEHLIPTLIRAAHTGETIPFVSHASHDFIDVEDIANGIVTLSKQRARGIFELGSGQEWTNQNVKLLVEYATGKEIKTREVTNMRAYDNVNWVSTNFRARQFGWSPKKTLGDSIKEMVSAYDK